MKRARALLNAASVTHRCVLSVRRKVIHTEIRHTTLIVDSWHCEQNLILNHMYKDLIVIASLNLRRKQFVLSLSFLHEKNMNEIYEVFVIYLCASKSRLNKNFHARTTFLTNSGISKTPFSITVGNSIKIILSANSIDRMSIFGCTSQKKRLTLSLRREMSASWDVTHVAIASGLPICLEESPVTSSRRRGINRNVGQGRWHPGTGFSRTSVRNPAWKKWTKTRFRFVFTTEFREKRRVS